MSDARSWFLFPLMNLLFLIPMPANEKDINRVMYSMYTRDKEGEGPVSNRQVRLVVKFIETYQRIFQSSPNLEAPLITL